MTDTPIFNQLRRELGDPREPLARLQVLINEVLAIMGGFLGIDGIIVPDDPAARRRAYWADAILTCPVPHGILLRAPSPIYDALAWGMFCAPRPAMAFSRLATLTVDEWSRFLEGRR